MSVRHYGVLMCKFPLSIVCLLSFDAASIHIAEDCLVGRVDFCWLYELRFGLNSTERLGLFVDVDD